MTAELIGKSTDISQARFRGYLLVTFKLANIFLSKSQLFCGSPTLLCRTSRDWQVRQDGGEAVLSKPGTYDFTTFFNAFPIKKWLKYTSISVFRIHLEVKGAACSLMQTRADSFSRYSEPIEGTRVEMLASDEWKTIDAELAYGKRDSLISFVLESEGCIELRNCYYYAEVEASAIRPVELALCTTTYKKEDYILRNIELMKNEIIKSDNAIADHFYAHVVDNGCTLDAEALSDERISIHPNNNVGGAGGFARGMIESLEQIPKATHVLLMDDDVVISPESIIRTYNLLSLAREEYVDAFLGGSMMSIDEPSDLYESMGFMRFDGVCDRMHPTMHMDVLHDVAAIDEFDIPSYLPGCSDQNQNYFAWWYCVIPVTQIERNGLPMPFFVRYDDVEYSRRCKPKFMNMIGICVWHSPFFMRYSGASERYQTTRNAFIAQYASDFAPLSDFESMVNKAFFLEITRFNYDHAALVVRGLEDFLKGPEYIMEPVAQQAFMDANKAAEKMKAISELDDELRLLGVDLDKITDWMIYRDAPTSKTVRVLSRFTYNGHRGPKSFIIPGKVAVIDAFDFEHGLGKLPRAETVVAIDIPNRLASIRRRDFKRFDELHSRFRSLISELHKRDGELRTAYKAAFPQMTSIPFWKKYLGIAE